MKHAIYIAAIAFSTWLTEPVLAQQQPASPPAQGQQTAPPPAQVDEQVAKMQELITQMNQQMAQLQQTQDPAQRQRLWQEHWTTMQSAMGMMQGMWGSTAGCCGAGGMMGPMMMWNDYRNLTPEQLRQRQYMMDRWLPMQQMMMNHMMQQQGWMMQQQPAPAPVR